MLFCRHTNVSVLLPNQELNIRLEALTMQCKLHCVIPYFSIEYVTIIVIPQETLRCRKREITRSTMLRPWTLLTLFDIVSANVFSPDDEQCLICEFVGIADDETDMWVHTEDTGVVRSAIMADKLKLFCRDEYQHFVCSRL